MGLEQSDVDNIVKFVKIEPRTIQEISKYICKSWVTTDSYVKKIKDSTGLINVKIFRKGTQGALKLVYLSQDNLVKGDSLEKDIYAKIRSSKWKKDFDFFEIFQFIPDDAKKVLFGKVNKKHVSKEQDLVSLLRQANEVVYCFSGNLSFINMSEKGVNILDLIEELLKRKVFVRIITRVTVSSLNNIAKLSYLLKKYPQFIEIRHAYQPLRGFIVDDKVARFKSEEYIHDYKNGELAKDSVVLYEIYDERWISWLQRVFWNLFRPALDYDVRLKQFKKFF